MKQITLKGLSFICLFVLGACTAPQTNPGATPEKTDVQQQNQNQKLERVERSFFDHGGSFK
jgi:outer membrane biogenesis lipoprotein LolB